MPGLIGKIQPKEEDIFDKPDLGKFDVITSDLPFGMVVSKGKDLEDMYKCFIDYVEKSLNNQGGMIVYTSKCEIWEKVVL